MRNFDPFFAPDRASLRRTYDVIACSETAEHFDCPGDEFQRLDRLLRPGWLANPSFPGAGRTPICRPTSFIKLDRCDAINTCCMS
jgi:hypothetical protein